MKNKLNNNKQKSFYFQNFINEDNKNNINSGYSLFNSRANFVFKIFSQQFFVGLDKLIISLLLIILTGIKLIAFVKIINLISYKGIKSKEGFRFPEILISNTSATDNITIQAGAGETILGTDTILPETNAKIIYLLVDDNDSRIIVL